MEDLYVVVSLDWLVFVFFKDHIFLTCTNFFIYIFLAALSLCCCMRAFSSCSEWRLLSSLGALASHCGGFSCCIVVAQGLIHCGSWTLEWAGFSPEGSVAPPCVESSGAGMEPMSPALAGRFSSTVPPA